MLWPSSQPSHCFVFLLQGALTSALRQAHQHLCVYSTDIHKHPPRATDGLQKLSLMGRRQYSMPSVVRRCTEGFGNAKDACLPLARGRLPRGELEWCWGRKEPGGLKSGRPGEPQHRAGCVTCTQGSERGGTAAALIHTRHFMVSHLILTTVLR